MVISVGVATVAAAVGAGGLGTYIFRGLRQNDNNLLLAGALASALLALLCDFALGQVERSFKVGQRSVVRRRIAAVGAAAIFVVLVAASYISNFSSEIPKNVQNGRRIVVASKDFTDDPFTASSYLPYTFRVA